MERPCFSHGQLYVSFSRAHSFNDVYVQIEQSAQQGGHHGALIQETLCKIKYSL